MYRCNDAVIDETLKNKQKQYQQIRMDGEHNGYSRYRMANGRK